MSPVTNENLVFLSSRQALADLAHFIGMMNDSYGLHTSKWITFGGSYPGMLAAWARLEYPEIVHAAVSNSAPIQMEIDFAAYNDRVAFDLQYPLVGGSGACLQVVLDGHHDIVDAISTGYHKEIAGLFDICDADSLLLHKNVEMFIGDGVIRIPAQGNDPSCDKSLCNIEKVESSACFVVSVLVVVLLAKCETQALVLHSTSLLLWNNSSVKLFSRRGITPHHSKSWLHCRRFRKETTTNALMWTGTLH